MQPGQLHTFSLIYALCFSGSVVNNLTLGGQRRRRQSTHSLHQIIQTTINNFRLSLHFVIFHSRHCSLIEFICLHSTCRSCTANIIAGLQLNQRQCALYVWTIRFVERLTSPALQLNGKIQSKYYVFDLCQFVSIYHKLFLTSTTTLLSFRS